MQYQRMEFRNVGWRGKLGLVLALALGLGIVAALVVLSLGIAIILLPVAAVASLIGWFRWKKVVAAVREDAAGRPGDRVIEIDYQVLDNGRGGRR